MIQNQYKKIFSFFFQYQLTSILQSSCSKLLLTKSHPSQKKSNKLCFQVKFVDADSPTYAKNKHCEFWLQGSGGGVLASPRHSLPRNSTCLYHLRGAGPALPSPTPPRPLPKFPEQRPGTVWRRPAPRAPQPQFRVWLSILKFHVGTSLSTGDEDCSTTLMVWDGEMMPLSECYDPTWLVLF